MGILLTREGLFSAGTAFAGVLLFVLAPYLPSVFPPSFARMVGFMAVVMSLVPLWARVGNWVPPLVVGGSCLAVMIVAHLIQTRGGQTPHDR